MSFLRSGYYGLSWLSAPFVAGYLKRRASKGHEDSTRLKERVGLTTVPRPNKPVVWMHAVSVGEAITALTIIQAILKTSPDIHVLLTTTTVASASIVQKRLPKHVTHQYCPVDTPQAVTRFLNHWQPDLAIWIESELWPNLMHLTQERGIPTILLNGRMSAKSFSHWKKLRGVVSPLLSRLSLCAVQSEEQVAFFTTLGATNVTLMRNAKVMGTPLKVDPQKYTAFKKELGNRPVWLMASTQPGEEEIVFKTHKILKEEYPTLLTILVPRHIERGEALHQIALQEGIPSALRTHRSPLKDIELYIGDTLGEMGLFYALSPLVVMGATFVPKGGHNPIEAAQLGAFVLHGPHTFKNPQLYDILASLGLSKSVNEQSQLSPFVLPWLELKKENYNEPQKLKAYREEGLQNLKELLSPFLKTLRDARG